MAKSTKTESTTRPVHEIRCGGIKAAIWKNDTANGPRHQATFTRSYQVDGKWNTTASYGPGDLAVLSQVASLAFAWITEADAAARAE